MLILIKLFIIFLSLITGDCPRDKFKKALEYINKRATAIIAKLMEFRQCQKELQDHIIIRSVQEFPTLPSTPVIDRSSTLQNLFLKEAQCAYNIRGRLMRWKIQMMTVKRMIEHEIIYEQEGFHSAFDCKLIIDITCLKIQFCISC